MKKLILLPLLFILLLSCHGNQKKRYKYFENDKADVQDWITAKLLRHRDTAFNPFENEYKGELKFEAGFEDTTLSVWYSSRQFSIAKYEEGDENKTVYKSLRYIADIRKIDSVFIRKGADWPGKQLVFISNENGITKVEGDFTSVRNTGSGGTAQKHINQFGIPVFADTSPELAERFFKAISYYKSIREK